MAFNGIVCAIQEVDWRTGEHRLVEVLDRPTWEAYVEMRHVQWDRWHAAQGPDAAA